MPPPCSADTGTSIVPLTAGSFAWYAIRQP